MKKNLIFGILIISSPILFALVLFSDTFDLSWNQGRGGFLFAISFIVAEIVGLKLDISRKKLLAAIPLAILVIIYLTSLEFGLRDMITAYGESMDVPLIFSFTWMWDFVVMSVFVIIILSIYFGKRWIRIAPAGPIFLSGSAVILSLDAFFPYDTLGPLQYVVPYLVQINVGLVELFDLGLATARDNTMLLRGDHGPFALKVFWPSAGVHSVIIFSLVMMAFLLKMNIPRMRKTIWFTIGIVGTITVNIIRIFSLSWYALKVTTNAAKWEEFHSIAGEIMFLPWLFAFLLVVMMVETRRLKKLEGTTSDDNKEINKV